MRRAALRALLLVFGLALTAYVIASLGGARIAAALEASAPFLPLVVLAELGIVATDVLAARTLLGDRAPAVTRATWIRSTGLAYAFGVLLPAGRAAGEAARAATLKRDVGLEPAAAAGSRLQTASLFGTAAASAVAALAVGQWSPLAGALAANALLCAALGAGLLSLVRSPRVTTWLRARLGREALTTASALPPGALARAVGFCSVGRLVQALQYGIVLHAVGGVLTPRSALLAQGVHIVGATVGDAIPNQLGVTDGAYKLFASSVGLGDEPARAVSIALCVRLGQLGLAGIGWGAAMFARRER